ncbi:glycoside hydrolase family protein [Bacteroides bouchesdurhonensis]|uniref:hypothetical protein n=1 Tax=Bacteroides bouchesdurhonensis TaxID=1841855 RepID=UPI0011DE3E4E|nr:hypothetical protein [Bacteroides bouchesdurhonensis]
MNKQLFKIADIVTAHLQDMKSIGLAEGKMGVVLFYYEFSRYLSLEIDNHLANNLLDEVLSKAGKVGNNGIELGLAGIGWGINYLIRNEFVEVTEDALIDLEYSLFSGESVDFGINFSMLSPAVYLLSKYGGKEMLENYDVYVLALLNTCRYYCLSIYDNKKKPLDLINSMLYFLLGLKKQNVHVWEADKLIWKILTYLLDYKDIEKDIYGDTVILFNLLHQMPDSTFLKKEVMARLSNLKDKDWSIEAYRKILWQQILFSQWSDNAIIPEIDKLLYLIDNEIQDLKGICVPLGIYLMNMNKSKKV